MRPVLHATTGHAVRMHVPPALERKPEAAMKRKTLTLLVLGLSGCGLNYDPAAEVAQRDIYTRLEDCVADWGDKDLCLKAEELRNEEGRQQAQNSPDTQVAMVPPFLFLGPLYLPSQRVAYRDGQAIYPRGQRAVTVRTIPRSAVPASARRGGFGTSASRAGSSGG